MMDFEKELKALKDKVNAKMKADASTEEIESFKEIGANIDSIQKEIEAMAKDNLKLKDLLISNIKGESFAKKDDSIENKEKSMEECLKDILKNK